MMKRSCVVFATDTTTAGSLHLARILKCLSWVQFTLRSASMLSLSEYLINLFLPDALALQRPNRARKTY